MCNSTHVAAAVLAQFEALAKTGKPQPHEHTVLAGIALTLPPPGQQPQQPAPPPDGQYLSSNPAPSASFTAGASAAAADIPEPSTLLPQQPPASQQQPAMHKKQPVPAVPLVVAIATGTKCLPASKRDPSGRALNDCHAEVCCRRALLRWLYCEMLETVRLYRSGVQDGTAVLQLQRFQRPQSPAAADTGMAGSAPGTVKPGAQDGATVGPGPAEPGAGYLRQLPLLPGWQFVLRPGVQLHMFVSQPPCGDASIFQGVCAAHDSSSLGDVVAGQATSYQSRQGQPQQQQVERQVEQDQRQPVGLGGSAAQPAIGEEAAGNGHGPAQPGRRLGRTGAKPVKRSKVSHAQWQPSSLGDLPPTQRAGPALEAAQQAGPELAAACAAWVVPQAHEVETYGEAQPVGLVRRKPGRGEATLSLSCSDKLARWRLLGLQGSLLRGLLSAPLHLSSLTVAVSTPFLAGHCGGSASSPPAAEAAVEAPCPAAIEAVAAAARVEAAAAAALRRALVDRIQPLVEHLPGQYQHAVLPLAVRVVCSGAGADPVPNPHEASTLGAAGPVEQKAPSLLQPSLASKQEWSPALGRSCVSGGPGAVLRFERLSQLGLVPGGPRKVAGGSTLLWHAPPSTRFLAKGGLKAVACEAQLQVQDQQQQQQQQGCSKVCQAGLDMLDPATLPLGADVPATTLYTVKGGTQEAVAGTTGLKLGVARKGAALPPPAAASFACKESLARLFLDVVQELQSLPQHPPQHSGEELAGRNPASEGTVATGGGGTPKACPPAARAGAGEPAVVASAAVAPLGHAYLQSLPGLQWEGSSYRQLKQLAGTEYQQAWGSLLAAPGSAFEAWIPKPAGLEDFVVSFGHGSA